MPFKALHLSESVLRGVQAAGYTDPTPIQLRAIPVVLAGGDLIGSAQTGTGKHGADKIARRLRIANHSVAVLHANRTQNQRMEALAGFKSGKYEIMVATDIAARGIDVAGVTHVINYDVPENPEDYVHRIGRTGRAQAVGDAFTLVTPEDAGGVRAIERFIGQQIPQLQLEGFSYQAFAPRPPQPRAQRPHGGGPGGLHPRGGYRRFRGRR
ncbi:MAG: hypothetical protein FJ399_22420 [Verrucomicrobia bacterium]|nr:hypothetical protein [Verrucomicrobiota bacterium]